MVKVLEKRKSEWNGIKRKYISEDTTIYFSGFDTNDAKKRARVFKKLWERTEGCEIIDSNAIPVKIACMGRAAIAAYLYSVHQLPMKKIAAKLDVSETTINQYVSDFTQERR